MNSSTVFGFTSEQQQAAVAQQQAEVLAQRLESAGRWVSLDRRVTEPVAAEILGLPGCHPIQGVTTMNDLAKNEDITRDLFEAAMKWAQSQAPRATESLSAALADGGDMVVAVVITGGLQATLATIHPNTGQMRSHCTVVHVLPPPRAH